MARSRKSIAKLAGSCLRDFRRDECAATSIEYAIIAAGIAGAVIVTVQTLGGTIYDTFYSKLEDLKLPGTGTDTSQ